MVHSGRLWALGKPGGWGRLAGGIATLEDEASLNWEGCPERGHIKSSDCPKVRNTAAHRKDKGAGSSSGMLKACSKSAAARHDKCAAVGGVFDDACYQPAAHRSRGTALDTMQKVESPILGRAR